MGQRFCDDMDFSGDVQVLFRALDVHRHNFITLDELDFLKQYQGDRFPPDGKNCVVQKFNYGLARLKKCQEGRKCMQEKLVRERTRSDMDHEARTLERMKAEALSVRTMMSTEFADLSTTPLTPRIPIGLELLTPAATPLSR